MRGRANFTDRAWQGHLREEFRAVTVDLGAPKPIASVRAGFLQETSAGIYLPDRVLLYTSVDGRDWSAPLSLGRASFGSVADPGRAEVAFEGLSRTARYVRLVFFTEVWVFIDEVEEIASRRGGIPPSPTQGVTNELLKLVAEFREHQGRLLICATNFVRALDAAFLRHGRFDYVIPIGLPDAEARAAIWRRYIPKAVLAGIDSAALVAASEGFTPADIEYAARKASQEALARALRSGDDPSAGEELATADYLEALAGTRATVSAETVEDFLEDITTIARL